MTDNSPASTPAWAGILITIVVTALIVGAIMWSWRQTGPVPQDSAKLQQSVNELQTQNNDLRAEIERLQNELNKEQSADGGYRLIDNACTYEQCLFVSDRSPDYPAGRASLSGYYTKYLDKAWGEEKYCDSLTVTGGTSTLIDSFVRLVDKGNTIYDKNERNQPIVNLDISKLTDADRQKFLNSTETNPAELVVFQPIEAGRGVGVCFAAMGIVDVK